jgi:type I site-specific restriction-modification system R (restriction) subunit
MTTQAKRRLTDISFEHEGAHVALVSKQQGGPANGVTTLITKATNSISKELVEKATTVTVEMQFPEFLRKFFGMYWDDAEVLSVAMGYGRTEYEDDDVEVKDWIDKRVESINILKSVYRAENLEKALADLTPEQSVAILKDQEMLEKALENLPEQTKLKHEEEVTQMEQILKSAHLEALADAVAIEKAAGVAAVAEIQKSLDAQVELLKAANAELEVFKSAAATAKVEARKAALTDAKVSADKVEAVLKSLATLDDEAFAATVETMKALSSAVDASDLMTETGVAGAGAENQEEVDRTTAILKARYGVK